MRGFTLAATTPEEGYLMITLVSLRNFPGARNTLEKAVASLCGLPVTARPTATPLPTSTSTPTASPTTPPTPSATPTSQPELTPTATAGATLPATPTPPPAATPTATPLLTPTTTSDWIEWQVQETVVFSLPHNYNVVNFTIKNWQNVYTSTLAQDSYLRDAANRVRSGEISHTLFMATSPATDTTPLRVMLVNAPELAGAERPTPEAVQIALQKAGVKGKVGKAGNVGTCGAFFTRFELAGPPGGAALTATNLTKGYMLILLGDSTRPADRPVFDRIMDSMCILMR